MVAVDILGALPNSETGNSNLLVAGDYFTRWMEAYPIPNMEATTVARKLTNEFFLLFWRARTVSLRSHSKQFESKLLNEVCTILRIDKTRTTLYHPQSNGLIEHFNRTLLSMLSTSIDDNPFQWEEYVDKVFCIQYFSTVLNWVYPILFDVWKRDKTTN